MFNFKKVLFDTKIEKKRKNSPLLSFDYNSCELCCPLILTWTEEITMNKCNEQSYNILRHFLFRIVSLEIGNVKMIILLHKQKVCTSKDNEYATHINPMVNGKHYHTKGNE